jgi:phosphoribosylformimino-5-aminoimidazole carboxamide ribotide isomerase
MIIYPAIDIQNGKCVRLKQGDAEQSNIFFENPLDAAYKWKEMGSKYLHVVDLDGAFKGESINASLIKQIKKETGFFVQTGGGIRSMDKIAYLIEEGLVDRVIIGTAAIEQPHLVKEAVERYGTKIAIGIDAWYGKVAIKGWVEKTDISSVSLALKMKEYGVDTIIYTDIEKDGMLTGPNIDETDKMIQQTGMQIIASGGISGIKDINNLLDINAAGAITGRAIYTGDLDLAEAIELTKE